MDRGAPQGDRLPAGLQGLSRHLLGPVRREGPSDPRHRLRIGPTPSVSPDGPERGEEGVLNIAFKIADDEKLPLLDLKDLQSLLQDLADRAGELTTKYGNITKASIGSIQRSLLVLQQQGADHFFGEPALKVSDLMRVSRDGRGYISVLVSDKLMQSPRLYATFLLFLMSELFEELP